MSCVKFNQLSRIAKFRHIWLLFLMSFSEVSIVIRSTSNNLLQVSAIFNTLLELQYFIKLVFKIVTIWSNSKCGSQFAVENTFFMWNLTKESQNLLNHFHHSLRTLRAFCGASESSYFFKILKCTFTLDLFSFSNLITHTHNHAFTLRSKQTRI